MQVLYFSYTLALRLVSPELGHTTRLRESNSELQLPEICRF